MKVQKEIDDCFFQIDIEDDSDVSSLTVNEKQIGVRFENVRKVYNTDMGEIIAVDDFTLKLCEGEVTSLLGRNGAGKTTIMYANMFFFNNVLIILNNVYLFCFIVKKKKKR